MNLLLLFIQVLQCKFVFSSYMASETNLLEVLSSYIEEREVYVQKMSSYLKAFEESYNVTTNIGSSLYQNKHLTIWKGYKQLKRATVDWKNFFIALNKDSDIVDKITKSVYAKHSGELADWTIEKNDFKLMRIVRNLINVPKNETTKPALKERLREQLILKLSNIKESIKHYAKKLRFTPEINYDYWSDYKKLCRGEVLLHQENKNLKCKYVHNNNPYLFIGPFKQEHLYLDPQIVMFHDVINDDEIRKLRKIASRKEMSISQGKETLYRVSKVSWLTREEGFKISQRLHHMTNLNMSSGEYLQLSVYGLAGHFSPHYDSGYDKVDPTSVRLSTVMFYLNDVTKGGATAFPYIKLTVFPKKGSAIFWYNLKPDYTVDSRTLHGGCPLYSGVKWVMNSWVAYSGQEFAKPCLRGRKY